MRETQESSYYSIERLSRHLCNLQGKPIIVFDLETNGLSPRSSVLSVSAIKFAYDTVNAQLVKIDNLERFYYGIEPPNHKALSINGLYQDVIEEKRGSANYTSYFRDDGDIPGFFTDSGLVVAHNVDFDKRFLYVFPELKELNYFCTMKAHGRYRKLYELARTEGMQVETDRLHESTYDCEIAAFLLEKLIGAL